METTKEIQKVKSKTMATKTIFLPPRFFVNAQGKFLGQFCGYQQINEKHEVIEEKLAKPKDPEAIEVPAPPANGRDTWDGNKWVPHTPAIKTLDDEIAEQSPMMRAIMELVPGGADAVKAKLGEMRPTKKTKGFKKGKS